MIGIHAYWSNPTLSGTFGHHVSGTKEDFFMYPFELLHFICSALQWKALNGPIHLYTDEVFYNYLKERNYHIFWDKIDTSMTKEFNKLRVDSRYNWTSFKTWLVGKLDTPFLVLDHDNMVYTKIPEQLYDCDVRFAHFETLDEEVYKDRDELEVEGFEFKDWDWEMAVANTCMMYFRSKKLAEEYSTTALDFLSKHKPTSDIAKEKQYLFADQRLLGMILEYNNANYGTFSNTIFDVRASEYFIISEEPLLDEVGFDHTWFYKHELARGDKDTLTQYVNRHREYIEQYQPKFVNLLKPLFDVN